MPSREKDTFVFSGYGNEGRGGVHGMGGDAGSGGRLPPAPRMGGTLCLHMTTCHMPLAQSFCGPQACAHGETSITKGNQRIQTRSGLLKTPSSTGSPLSPSEATSHHHTPDQNQSRQRAVHHTSGCMVFACLNADQQYTLPRPRFCPQAYRVAVWRSRHN